MPPSQALKYTQYKTFQEVISSEVSTRFILSSTRINQRQRSCVCKNLLKTNYEYLKLWISEQLLDLKYKLFSYQLRKIFKTNCIHEIDMPLFTNKMSTFMLKVQGHQTVRTTSAQKFVISRVNYVLIILVLIYKSVSVFDLPEHFYITRVTYRRFSWLTFHRK